MRSSSAGTSSAPLNDVGVDHRDADEDDALEVAREHAQQREQRVPPEAAVAADEEDRDRLARGPARQRLARRADAVADVRSRSPTR